MQQEQVMVVVNAEIRAFADRFSPAHEEWEFICECGCSDCAEHVPLGLTAYDHLRQTGQPVLAEGHPLARARRARDDARAAQQDAAALRAQARHQLRRAKRNQSP